ncbi:hypothetical protein JTB14_008823 [Gonioctena quinquepunctata]|nr:hypothetical protein JTB14_032288 [Gonioctena quinquepunctata]KAG5872774.1 hypothetical protein JTB14_008823 [Gonioctena quinquepunctata]
MTIQKHQDLAIRLREQDRKTGEKMKEASNGKNGFHWQDAIVQEFENLINNRTWNFIEQPENIEAVKTKWVFKTKIMRMVGSRNSKLELLHWEILKDQELISISHMLRLFRSKL